MIRFSPSRLLFLWCLASVIALSACDPAPPATAGVAPLATVAVMAPTAGVAATATSAPMAAAAPMTPAPPTATGSPATPTAAPVPSATPTRSPTSTPTPTALPTAAPAKTPGVRTIFVDPGHGGADVGAVHAAADGTVDLVEKELNLDVGKRLGALLTAGGYHVIYGRLTDAPAAGAPGGASRTAVRADMQARVAMANAAQADLFIDIHHNGHGNKDLAGAETYYCADRPFADKSKLLAQLTVDSIVKELARHRIPGCQSRHPR